MIDNRRSHGTHLLIDLWGARYLDDANRIQEALIRAALHAGATLLHVQLHKFEPHGGVTGVVLLAESHLSIHTWPEHDYAALDVFMCGGAKPERTIPIIEETFSPQQSVVLQAFRGVSIDGSSKIELTGLMHVYDAGTQATVAQAPG